MTEFRRWGTRSFFCAKNLLYKGKLIGVECDSDQLEIDSTNQELYIGSRRI